MRNRELVRQHQRLIALFSRVDAACGSDIEMRSEWARYLCVLCSGFVENAVDELYSAYARRTASPAVANYASHHLRNVLNPKMHRLIGVAKLFKPEWAADLEQFATSMEGENAIDSIMSNRHLIAH